MKGVIITMTMTRRKGPKGGIQVGATTTMTSTTIMVTGASVSSTVTPGGISAGLAVVAVGVVATAIVGNPTSGGVGDPNDCVYKLSVPLTPFTILLSAPRTRSWPADALVSMNNSLT